MSQRAYLLRTPCRPTARHRPDSCRTCEPKGIKKECLVGQITKARLSSNRKQHAHLNNVRMMIISHDDHFVEQQFTSLLLEQIHLFDCDLLAGASFGCNANDSSGSFADFNEILVIRSRIVGVHHQLQGGSELFV